MLIKTSAGSEMIIYMSYFTIFVQSIWKLVFFYAPLRLIVMRFCIIQAQNNLLGGLEAWKRRQRFKFEEELWVWISPQLYFRKGSYWKTPTSLCVIIWELTISNISRKDNFWRDSKGSWLQSFYIFEKRQIHKKRLTV